MAYWNLSELRLRQRATATSAADALNVWWGPVPAGKIWVVVAAGYHPSVAETQVVGWMKLDNNNYRYQLVNPASMALSPTIQAFTFIEQGMECMLFPGDYIYARRNAATGGSTMTLYLEYVEIDLPLYVYEEPQVVKRTHQALSSIRQSLSAPSAPRGGSEPAPSGGGTEGGGRGLPI